MPSPVTSEIRAPYLRTFTTFSMSGKRYIRLFTEPPKESEWHCVEKDIENALRRNVERVQQQTGTSEGRRESVYLGDVGVVLMELTLAERQRSLPILPPNQEVQGNEDLLSPDHLTSLADHHLASAFHDSASSFHTIRDGAHASFIETPIGIATLVLSRYPIGKHKHFARGPYQRSLGLLQKAREAIKNDDRGSINDGGCEVLYGRAGFLYALLYLRGALKKVEKQQTHSASTNGGHGTDDEFYRDLESCRALFSDATLGEVTQSIIYRGRYGAQAYRSESGDNNSPPLMWSWHGKRYLGGAHGIAGILQMLLRCPHLVISDYMPEIVQTIDWLINCQDHTGNWPTTAPISNQLPPEGHDLVQWCHGAPAMLFLLSTILRLSVTPGVTTGLTDKQKDRFVVALQRGCAVVYMRGLLCKGVGLCHGTAGSVYALLAASDVLDELCGVNAPSSSESSPDATPPSSAGNNRSYFAQALHLAQLATYASSLVRKGEMMTPDHPWSLYEGMAGMCCAWEEILYRLHSSRCFSCSGMPGYDDLLVE